MNRIALFLVIVSIFVLGCATSPPRPVDGMLRYDGIYQSEKKVSGTTGYWYYIRFYPDGTVIKVSSIGQPENLRNWFSKEDQSMSVGKFIIKNKHISFSTTSSYGTVDHTGLIDGNKLRLDSYSHINQNRETNNYVFVEW